MNDETILMDEGLEPVPAEVPATDTKLPDVSEIEEAAYFNAGIVSAPVQTEADHEGVAIEGDAPEVIQV